MSKWVANGCDHSQTAAGKVMAVCGRFHAKIIIIFSKLFLELIRKAHFIMNKQLCLHQKFVNSLHIIPKSWDRLQMVANGRNCDHLGFDVSPNLHKESQNHLGGSIAQFRPYCRHFTKLTGLSAYTLHSDLIPPTDGANGFL